MCAGCSPLPAAAAPDVRLDTDKGSLRPPPDTAGGRDKGEGEEWGPDTAAEAAEYRTFIPGLLLLLVGMSVCEVEVGGEESEGWRDLELTEDAVLCFSCLR